LHAREDKILPRKHKSKKNSIQNQTETAAENPRPRHPPSKAADSDEETESSGKSFDQPQSRKHPDLRAAFSIADLSAHNVQSPSLN
jgi:hypothetical protein